MRSCDDRQEWQTPSCPCARPRPGVLASPKRHPAAGRGGGSHPKNRRPQPVIIEKQEDVTVAVLS